MNGVVAAGHPLTAEAGAKVLREGGNAVDAAVCAVLASFAAESPLTGFGAGGFMMVHESSGATSLIDFFVAAPGADGVERRAELVPVPVHFDEETVQTFYVGPASCGVPGTAAGLEQALQRFGSAPLADLVGPAVRLAREGAAVNAEQAYILDILDPIHERLEGTRRALRPGRAPAAGGRRVPLSGAGGSAGAVRRRRRGALLPRRGRGGPERVRPRARRHARARRTWPPMRRYRGGRSGPPSAAPRC